MTDADPLVVVAVDETTNAKTGIVTRSPIYSRLSEVKAARVVDLQQQIRDHVDQHLPPQEREALSGLLQSTMLRRSEGLAVDPFAMMALLAALDWAEQSLVWGNTLAQAVAAAPDLAAVQAVSAETAIAALKPPPVVTAGEIATALRRTPPES